MSIWKTELNNNFSAAHVHDKVKHEQSTAVSALWIIFYVFAGLVITLAVIAVAILVWQKREEDKKRKRFF